MPEVVVGGVRIAYQRRGSGAPLVLFHGAFEDSRVWTEDLERLSTQLDVIAWDAPDAVHRTTCRRRGMTLLGQTQHPASSRPWD